MQYQYQSFEYIPPHGLTQEEERKSVIIVGAGPIGLAAALDLASYGVASVVIDDNNVVSVGSRAICWAKRSLEILDRLGVGEKALQKGVTWKVGRTYHRDKQVFEFDLLPESGHKMPAFINLQQYYVEEFLVAKCQAHDLIDLRFKNALTTLSQDDQGVCATITTPDGPYDLYCDYLLACDGARSPIRTMMELEFDGELFEERFLIADIEMEAAFPSERRFWFEPNFHQGQSALLHKQPDNIYRIDLQLGWDADVEKEREPERISERIAKMIGHHDFKIDWSSIYTFQCRRLKNFVHDRVIFLGDSAHVVSPFGARGGNGGLQDVDALGWRLAAVCLGQSEASILADYNMERIYASDENILNSARATRFMSPADGAENWFRDAVLSLAGKAPFAQPMVNSGRLSVPAVYPLNAPDDEEMPYTSRPGAVAPDAPLKSDWLLSQLGGRMTLLAIGAKAPSNTEIDVLELPKNDWLQKRYLGSCDQAFYLIRPDQIIAARWREADAKKIEQHVAALWKGTPCA